MNINEFSDRVFATQERNWGHIQRSPVEDLALIVTEVAEAIEDIRDGNLEASFDGLKPVGLPSEVADILIRTFNFAQRMGIDVEAALELKATYNDTRPIAHGGKKL